MNILLTPVSGSSACDRLHVITHGNSRHPPLLFLHGFLGDCRDFDRVIVQLQDQFYCLSLDLPGHGHTKLAGEYSMQRTAEVITNFLDQLKIAQITLVGYSMGGRLALYLALNSPLRFSSVVLESSSPGLKTEADRLARLQQDRELADRLEANFPKFLEDWYEQPLFESLKQHVDFATMKQRRLQNQPAELAKSLRQMSTGQQPNLWKHLPTYQHPLLLVVGERDRKFVTLNQEMVNLCPMAQLAIIPNAGHNVHLENSPALIICLRTFLAAE